MTKRKRLLAFILVLTLVVGVLAVHAAAYGLSGHSCGSYTGTVISASGDWALFDSTSCGHSPTGRHLLQRRSATIRCGGCGNTYSGYIKRTYCTVLGDLG